jgi:hypothetical protein
MVRKWFMIRSRRGLILGSVRIVVVMMVMSARTVGMSLPTVMNVICVLSLRVEVWANVVAGMSLVRMGVAQQSR